jgi:SAM-dependent methyltransferase
MSIRSTIKSTARKVHTPREVLEYWNQKATESMYDKNLLNLEIELIRDRIPANSKILDAGCGEGEATLVYSQIPKVKIDAVDSSDTRLKKASRRLAQRKNISLKRVDFLGRYSLPNDYDIVVSQRFLINLPDWELQKKVLLDLARLLKPKGKIILLEGSVQGVNSLNVFRRIFGLDPIPIKWHNLFFDDKLLIKLMRSHGMELIEQDGLGEYFMLTRGVRPIFDKKLDWSAKFNKDASTAEVRRILNLKETCSKLKLWVFGKTKSTLL